MSRIFYSCPFVPAEWIAAHRLNPARILPRALGGAEPFGPAIGVCPYARAFVNEVCCATPRGDRLPTCHNCGLPIADCGQERGRSLAAPAADAVVVTTVCDQMRRAAEKVAANSRAPLFLMHVPTTWQTVAARKLYLAELKRLGRFLVRVGGTEPTPALLRNVMRGYDAAREELRATRDRLSARQFSEAIAQLNYAGAVSSQSASQNSAIRNPQSAIATSCQPVPLSSTIRNPQSAIATGCQPVPLALVGSPLVPQHFGLFDLIEAAGGRVVLDATESGERTLPAPFNRRDLADDPFMTLADAYFAIPDAFRRPNAGLYSWLKRELAVRGVRGIIFRRYVWCDTWHAEARRMKEWADLPFLDVEVGDEPALNGHERSRIQAFLEMLK